MLEWKHYCYEEINEEDALKMTQEKHPTHEVYDFVLENSEWKSGYKYEWRSRPKED